MTPEESDAVFWLVISIFLAASLLCAFVGVRGILRRRGRDPVVRGLAADGGPEANEERARNLRQARHDANRASWDIYDKDVEAQRAALEALDGVDAPFPLMIRMSTQDYLWYVHVAHIHMPWKYENHTTRHIEKAPKAPTIEWGWRKVGVGQRTKSDAETILARVLKPDENYYLYDDTGLARGYVPKPADEDDDDA